MRKVVQAEQLKQIEERSVCESPDKSVKSMLRRNMNNSAMNYEELMLNKSLLE